MFLAPVTPPLLATGENQDQFDFQNKPLVLDLKTERFDAMRITFELLKATSKQIARRDEDEKSFLRRLTHLFLQAKGVSAPSNALYGGSELLMATADAGRIKVWSSLMGWRTSQTSRRALHSQSQLLRRRCERARVADAICIRQQDSGHYGA